jgi:putative ABC transport system permease protein
VITLLIALRALHRTRVRAALTALGITIGIAAVICTVAIGDGSAETIRRQLDALGENLVMISAGNRNIGGVRSGSGGARTLTGDDAHAIAASVPGIGTCSPQLTGRQQLVAGNRNWNTRFVGVSPDYFALQGWRIEAGTAFALLDNEQASRVVVLGNAVAEQLLNDQGQLPREVRLGRFVYTVIGVLQRRGSGSAGLNQDDVAVVPYRTARRFLDNRPWVDDVICSVPSIGMQATVEEGVTTLLRERHRLDEDEPDDFTLRRPQDRINLRVSSAETMTQMIAGLASIALIVGGIGVMNIMLVSVTERTTEIGLRLAIGARSADIQLQFLIEAMVLGLIGGLAGVAVGVAGAHVIAEKLDLPIVLSANAITWGVLASVGTGLVFGFFPAREAAKLDPIVALRTEP